MSTGISAPPMRMEATTPTAVAIRIARANRITKRAPEANPATTARAMAANTRTRRIPLWPRRTVGFDGNKLASLALAIRLAEKVPAPISSPMSPDTSGKVPIPAAGPRQNSTNETKNAAMPPAPCWKAIIAGIWIMLTRRATPSPTKDPTTRATVMSSGRLISMRTSTAAIAQAIAREAVHVPRRALGGVRKSPMPTMSTTIMTASITR